MMMALGGGTAIICIFIASYVPRQSFILFYVLISAGLGILNGLSYTVPIRLGWRAMPERSGLVSGLIIAGAGIGSLVFTSVSTHIVNPDNISQQVVGKTDDGDEILAFPESVTQKVPYLLRCLSICYTIIVILAILLVREQTDLNESEFSTDSDLE